MIMTTTDSVPGYDVRLTGKKSPIMAQGQGGNATESYHQALEDLRKSANGADAIVGLSVTHAPTDECPYAMLAYGMAAILTKTGLSSM